MARGAVRAPTGRNVPAALPPGIPQCGTARCPYQKWHPHSSGGRDGARRRPRPNRAQGSGGFTAGDPAMRDSAMSLPKMAPSLIRCGRDGAPRRPRPKRAQHLPAALPPGTAQRAVPTGFKTDSAAALSLPLIGKLRALAVGEINKRPVLRTRRQVFPHWILQNVISLFAATFLVSQPVFEKIALPADAELSRGPAFPGCHDLLHVRSARFTGGDGWASRPYLVLG